MLPKTICGISAVLLLIDASMPATAADRKNGTDLISAVASCRQVSDPKDRLACYDRNVGSLATAAESRAVIVLSKEEIAEKRQAAFGLQSQTADLLDRSDTKAPEITQLDSTVSRISASGRDRLMIRLADGSTWRTLEKARIDPRIGEKVRIRRAALGSFVGSYEHSGGIRMVRLR